MNVSLPAELERWIAQKVDGGQYASASEVVREGLQLLRETETHAARLETLRRDVQNGLEQLERGEAVDGEEAFDRVLARIGRQEDGTS